LSSFLFINQFYWPDEAATAQLLTDLAEHLVREGHSVTVVCGRGRYACKEKLKAGRHVQNGVQIYRVGGTDIWRWNMAARLLDIATFLSAARTCLRQLPRHDVVIPMSSPPLVARLAIPYCRRHRSSLVYWAQDLYPEIAEKLGAVRNKALLLYLRAKAWSIYRASRCIVVPGRDMAKLLESRKAARGKVCVVPNWADLDAIRATPVRHNTFRSKEGWQKDRVLIYSGNIGPAHDVETMFELVKELQQVVPGFRFVLTGPARRHKPLFARAKKMGIRVTLLEHQPRQSLGDFLGAADAHLVSQKPKVDGLLVPSKFYGAVAAGRPIIFIGSKTGEIGRMVLESQLGAVVESGQASAGIWAAKRAMLAAQEENATVAFIRDWAEHHASKSARLRQFQKILQEELIYTRSHSNR